jgi:hypothetical protein
MGWRAEGAARRGVERNPWEAMGLLQSLHAAPILLYGPAAGYAFLAVAAGLSAVGRRPLPAWFWTLSLLALVLVLVQAATGLLLMAFGARPRAGLHVLYGLLVLGAGSVQYGLRPRGLLRRTFAREMTWSEARALALLSLTQVALIARAWMTGLVGR